MINQIRSGLGRADFDVSTSAAARLVLNKITEKFNEKFGTDCAGTVFADHSQVERFSTEDNDRHCIGPDDEDTCW